MEQLAVQNYSAFIGSAEVTEGVRQEQREGNVLKVARSQKNSVIFLCHIVRQELSSIHQSLQELWPQGP